MSTRTETLGATITTPIADNPHQVNVAPTGLLEGCNSQRTGDTRPRGRTTTRLMQSGWTEDGRRIMEPITTPWIAKPCGSTGWPGCAGCCNNRVDTATGQDHDSVPG